MQHAHRYEKQIRRIQHNNFILVPSNLRLHPIPILVGFPMRQAPITQYILLTLSFLKLSQYSFQASLGSISTLFYPIQICTKYLILFKIIF